MTLKPVLSFFALLCVPAAVAQEVPADCGTGTRSEEVFAPGETAVHDALASFKFDTRADYQYVTKGGSDGGREPAAGFLGQYLNVVVDGRIAPRFSYKFRYRLNRDVQATNKFMNNVDWVNITYAPNERWSFTAGKQMLYFGTIEYDYAPIDCYYPLTSAFWNHIDCYQLGVTAAYSPSEGQQVVFQFANSPTSRENLQNLYCYNLMWYGALASWWHTMYSLNFVETRASRYMGHLALGNRFTMGCAALDVDYMGRYGGGSSAFWSDFTAIGKLDVRVAPAWNVFVKGGYDVNHAQASDTPEGEWRDTYVVPGTERGYWGAGVEYFPLKSHDNTVRVHAFWTGSTDAGSANTFNVGVRWQMNLLRWR